MANATAHSSARPPRRPSRRALVVAGVAVQLLFVIWGAVSLLRRPIRHGQPLLVRHVLIPEDMVYGDTEVAPKAGEKLPPVDMAKIILGTPAQVGRGAKLFKEHCVTCHGAEGMGNGPTGLTLDPRPRNLTSLEGWKRGTKLTDIFRTVTLGLEGTRMSGFDYLSVNERFALSHYVMTLATGHPRATQADLDSLDRQFALSEGAQEPNVEPISMAMTKLEAEATPVPAPLDSAKERELAAKEPRGAELFREVAQKTRLDAVGYLLASDSSWVGRPDRLRAIAASGVPANGFNARTALLSAGDWSSLYRYLMLRYRSH